MTEMKLPACYAVIDENEMIRCAGFRSVIYFEFAEYKCKSNTSKWSKRYFGYAMGRKVWQDFKLSFIRN